MNRNVICVALLAMACASAPAAAQDRKAADAGKPPKAVDSYDELYHRYLQAARVTGPVAPTPARSDWMTSLHTDPRARNVNDLLTVQVVEVISASGAADSSLDKSSSGAAGVSNLFGLEDKFPSWIDPTNLLSPSTESQFQGGGQTNRSGQLTAVMTVRVAEVLPNGDLVLEGAREIDINGDRQIVVLTGVIRPVDVPQTNVVASTRIGQLRIRYFGRGLIKDNLQPGWLIRLLNKIF